MKARLKPLTGKYYGTVVEFDNGGEAKFWFTCNPPSARWLMQWGITPQQWDENVKVPDGWGGLAPVREVYELCDNHYESHDDYVQAMELVEIVNKHSKK